MKYTTYTRLANTLSLALVIVSILALFKQNYMLAIYTMLAAHYFDPCEPIITIEDDEER